jgi:peptide/nickel transport system permease protein
MAVWLVRRVLLTAASVWVMTLLVFAGIAIIGNPVDVFIPPDASAADRDQLIADLGLNQPLYVQYWYFLSGLLRGDLGRSFVFNEGALPLILSRMPATLELAVCAVFLSIAIGVPLGIVAGLKPKARISRLIMVGSVFGFSLPTFWVGLMLILIFSVYLGWLPATGRGQTVSVLGIEWSFLTFDGLKHLFLPALNLSLFNVSVILRLTRAGVREILPMDYIRFARAKGLAPRRIVGVHVLKNILIPVVTVAGIEFGTTVAFAVVTETIFGWPGMGKLIIESINLLDRPVIVAYLMVTVVIIAVTNGVVDILYTLLDPRVRLDSQR